MCVCACVLMCPNARGDTVSPFYHHEKFCPCLPRPPVLLLQLLQRGEGSRWMDVACCSLGTIGHLRRAFWECIRLGPAPLSLCTPHKPCRATTRKNKPSGDLRGCMVLSSCQGSCRPVRGWGCFSPLTGHACVPALSKAGLKAVTRNVPALESLLTIPTECPIEFSVGGTPPLAKWKPLPPYVAP